MTMPAPSPSRRSRRDDIVDHAAQLFAARGYSGTAIDDIGAAVGVSGPAIYWHFPSKEALLAEMLVDISERLLEGGRRCVGVAGDAGDALERLVSWQVEFALDNRALIVVHTRELDNLPRAAQQRVRRLQRAYVEEWVDVLRRLHPDSEPDRLRAAAQAAIGLINATPYLRGELDRDDVAGLLRAMATTALIHGLDGSHRPLVRES